MLIKLQKSAGSSEYTIFDNVRIETYTNLPKPKPEAAWEAPDLFYYESTNPYNLNYIECFDANLKHLRIWFDGEAYICNDDGKTIHKIPSLKYCSELQSLNKN